MSRAIYFKACQRTEWDPVRLCPGSPRLQVGKQSPNVEVEECCREGWGVRAVGVARFGPERPSFAALHPA